MTSIDPRRPWRLSEVTKRAIVRAYAAGEKTAVIAAHYGVSPGYPGHLARRRNVPLRYRKIGDLRAAARRVRVRVSIEMGASI